MHACMIHHKTCILAYFEIKCAWRYYIILSFFFVYAFFPFEIYKASFHVMFIVFMRKTASCINWWNDVSRRNWWYEDMNFAKVESECIMMQIAKTSVIVFQTFKPFVCSKLAVGLSWYISIWNSLLC